MKKTILVLVLGTLAHAVHGGSFEDGRQEGRVAAEQLWSGDCDDSWEFEELCQDELINDMFAPAADDNWREEAEKEGARRGVREVVAEVEEECFELDPSMCNELGEAAAEILAADYCGTYDFRFAIDAKEDCLEAGIDRCEGLMFDKLEDYCSDTVPTSEQRMLQDECRDQVRSMVGYRRNLRGGE